MEYALITGATSGIGKEFAFALGKKGINLILTGRRKDNLEEIRKNLENRYRILVQIVIGEFSDLKVIDEVLNITKEKKIRYLINNVGYGNKFKFFEETFEENLKMVNVHIESFLKITYFLAPTMTNGYIINVSSLASFLPTKYNHMYVSTKIFINNFSRCLSYELKNKNIKVKCICPGFVETDFHRGMQVSFKSKYTFMKPKKVVNYTMKNLENGKVILIPGVLNKMVYLFFKIAPSVLTDYILSKQSKL